MKIGKRSFGSGKTLVIAEIGGNHEGSFAKAKKMIREAAKAGADAVKFQIFKAEKIVSADSKKPAYSGISHKKQWERFKGLEFTKKQYRELKKIATECGVIFMASVFDPDSVDETDSLIPAYKVASGDLTYHRLLKHLRKKKKPILLSTGASTMKEIKEAVRVIGKKDLMVLHCICAYPAPYTDANLKAIPKLAKTLGVPVGYSDHTVGIACSVAAVALGAAAIEKHFTLDPDIPYGDHRLSVTPKELKQMVEMIRVTEKALGDEDRVLYQSERRAQKVARRSLFIKRDLEAGQKIKTSDVVALRPIQGVPAECEERVIGKKIKRSIRKGDSLEFRHIR